MLKKPLLLVCSGVASQMRLDDLTRGRGFGAVRACGRGDGTNAQSQISNARIVARFGVSPCGVWYTLRTA